MAKLIKVAQRLFGINAGAQELAQIGSLANGTITVYDGASFDPVAAQALAQFLSGWSTIVMGGNSPAIEDMNSVLALAFRQIAYIQQMGVAEWDLATSYYIGSMVNVNGKILTSITDNNLNNLVTDGAHWSLPKKSLRIITSVIDTVATLLDEVIVFNIGGGVGDVGAYLPPAASCAGKIFIFKNVSVSKNLIIDPLTESIDGVVTPHTVGLTNAKTTIVSDGTGWLIIA